MTFPGIMVPVLTLRTGNGGVDLGATAAYAERAAATWLDLFLVSGTIGGGETSTGAERRANVELWSRQVPASRLLACVWTDDDLAHAVDVGVRPIVVLRDHADETGLVERLTQLPAGAFVYSHPKYTPTTFTPAVARAAAARGAVPAGGKICKVGLSDVEALRAACGDVFALYDGRCRHVTASVDAGATGVVTVPLCTLPSDLPGRDDSTALQSVIDRNQQRIDALPGQAARIAMLTDELTATSLA